ncbi:50S ribosomal protein L15 [Caenorhabditis elegans]|uniref:50S ribosomal protein L15 n=1 Tax=Caenorhabditis elegans TaxID=6239 RepID=U4PFA4_CAEEL|nr:50S ribosomal protein L15 [Caenorhabditis elegans]CDH93421.1 50S ribosomal protein L15 [Caenorhabditis elegans]|eukprot:NP_001294617.1 Uncharacterized protein CELE_Y69A2AR.50 [Caenorhabditis elegans]
MMTRLTINEGNRNNGGCKGVAGRK